MGKFRPKQQRITMPLQTFKTISDHKRKDKIRRRTIFVFSDHSPVKPQHARVCLKNMLTLAGFDAEYYSVHSLRAGRSCDLLKLGVSIDSIKKIWKMAIKLHFIVI